METIQQTTRKLVAFSALVLLGAGFPHYSWDRPEPRHSHYASSESSSEYLLPSTIGEFHVVERRTFPKKGDLIQIGAIYQDTERKHLAQIAIHIGPHDGLWCYIARGVPLERELLEPATTADSVANFNIAFLRDESLTGSGRANLLMAFTDCMATGCTAPQTQTTSGLQVVLPTWARQDRRSLEQCTLPLSITLQSLSEPANKWSEQDALKQFRALIANFRLLPLRNFCASN